MKTSKSFITTLPELDIFSVPPVQESIEKTYYTEHRPISTLSSDQQIQFNLKSGVDEYINLKDTIFYIKFKINLVKTGEVDLSDWKKVNLVNNTLHSMFKYVDLEIENKSLTQAPPTYAYKAYVENLLGFSEDAKMGYLTAEGWDINYESNIKDVSETLSELITPTTIDKTGIGKSIEFAGKLHIDLAMQSKSLLGGCKLTFTLIPNDPSFYVRIKDDTLKPRIIFEEAGLYISRSKIISPVVESHNLLLSKTNAKYPIMRGVVKTYPISSGSSDVNLDNVVVGQIPRRAFMMFVDSRGFNGDIKSNPFDFNHFNLSYLVASIDGVQFPSIPFKPDFTNNSFTREFLALYDVLNQTTTDTGITITRHEFKNGLAIFAINFAPDPTDECSKAGYLNEPRYGSINFNLKFQSALAQNIHALIYCEFDNMIEFDSARTPHFDFL